VSRSLVEIASLFHPFLYERTIAEKDSAFAAGLRPGLWADKASRHLVSAHTYMQSLLFLAGCTLSAAVIQDRFSSGTIESKLGRLWQAAQYARRGALPGVDPVELEAFIRHSAGSTADPYGRLMTIKKKYAEVLRAIGSDITAKPAVLPAAQLSRAQRERFDGVIATMHRLLPRDVECIIAYGSAVTSAQFSDYDLIVVVRDGERALRRLAGAHPRHDGRELNISVYDAGDFVPFQRCSGDNLDHAALCIEGTTVVPVKPRMELLFRNFSFAFVRLRQLLGMAAHLAKEGIHADCSTASLYNYFVKIPMHIVKGVCGAMGQPIAKEMIGHDMRTRLGYDFVAAATMCTEGAAWRAITDAYHATHATIHALNEELHAFTMPERGGVQ